MANPTEIAQLIHSFTNPQENLWIRQTVYAKLVEIACDPETEPGMAEMLVELLALAEKRNLHGLKVRKVYSGE